MNLWIALACLVLGWVTGVLIHRLSRPPKLWYESDDESFEIELHVIAGRGRGQVRRVRVLRDETYQNYPWVEEPDDTSVITLRRLYGVRW